MNFSARADFPPTIRAAIKTCARKNCDLPAELVRTACEDSVRALWLRGFSVPDIAVQLEKLKIPPSNHPARSHKAAVIES
jgi:hypothetical protein